MTITITGNRSTTDTVTTGGATYKRLETDGYTLEDFVARDWGGLVSVQKRAGVVRNLTIRNGKIYNIDRVVTLPYDDAELDTALFEDLDCYDLERGFFRLKRARNVTVRRVIARQRAVATTQFADAFATSDLPTANLKFEDVVGIGFDMKVAAGAYPNGGSYSDEELSVNTSYLRCVARDGNDGWDLKGQDTATACRAQNNHRNWRFWGATTITDCWSIGAGNAHFWFGGGSRLGANRLVRPRIIDNGTNKPWFKIDTHTAAASITVIDPIDGNGKLIPEATLLARVQYDATKLLTFRVQYTGATTFPAVDTTPRPPVISATGGGVPVPDESLAGPTNLKTVYDGATGRATTTWTPPAGATAVEIYERTNTPVSALGSFPVTVTSRLSAVLRVPGTYTFSAMAVYGDGRRSAEVVGDPSALVLPLETPPVEPGPDTPPVEPPVEPEDPGEPPSTPGAQFRGLAWSVQGGVRRLLQILRPDATPTTPTTPTDPTTPPVTGTADTWAQLKARAATTGRPVIIAHRGGGGEIARNNALSAIDQAVALGMGTDPHMIPDGGDLFVGADGTLLNSHDQDTTKYMVPGGDVNAQTAATWAQQRLRDHPLYRGTISTEAPPTARQTLEKARAIGRFTVPEDKDHTTSSRERIRDLVLDLGMKDVVQVQSFRAGDLGPAKAAGISVGLLQSEGNNLGFPAILTAVNGGPPDLVLYDPRSAPGNSDTWVKAAIDAGLALQVGTLSRRYHLDREKVRVANLGGNITLVPSDNPFYLARKNTPITADRWDTQFWEHGQIPSDTSSEPQVQADGSLRFGNAGASQWTLLGGYADETRGCWKTLEVDVVFEALDSTATRWFGLEWGLGDDRNFHDGTSNGVGSLALRFGQDGRIRVFHRSSATLSTLVADNVSVGTTSSTTLAPITAGQTVRLRVENLVDAAGAFTGQTRVTRLDTGQWVMTAAGAAPVRGPYMHAGKNGAGGGIIRIANLAVTYGAVTPPPPVTETPVESAAVTFLDSSRVSWEVDAASGPERTWTVPAPAGGGALAAGDLLVFALCFQTTTSTPPQFTTVPAGATALIPATVVVDAAVATRTLGAAVYYKTITAAEAAAPPDSYSFTFETAYDGTLSASRYRGVDAAAPFAISGGAVATATITSLATSKTSPAVTTTSASSLLLAGVMHRSGSAILTAGDPSGYTLAVNAFGIGGRGHGVAHRAQAAAGASSTAVWRSSNGAIGLAWQTALRRAGAATSTPPTVTAPKLAHRLVSEVTASTALINVKVSDARSVRLKVGTDAAVTAGVVFGEPVVPDEEGLAFLPVTGLPGGKTNCFYRVAMTDAAGVEVLDTGPVGRFRTDGPGPVSLSMGSCTDTADPDTFNAIAAWDDDLFLMLGDLFYADGSGTGLSNFQAKMNAKLAAARHALVWSTREAVYTPSDHDGMNNDVTGGNSATAWANWNAAYRRRFMPADRLPARGVWRTFTKGDGLVRFIVLDTRTFKSTPSAVDDASKTALGSVQKQWLKDVITAATENVIVLVNADPWIGAPSAGDDAWLGYTTERAELAAFFAASGKNLVLTGGDMHALAADSGANSPGGVPIFHAAPLYNESSIKGGPYSAGTYPTTPGATVKQYGRIVITPGATAVTVAFTGYSAPSTQRIALTKTFPR